jgi:uncharacterized protein (DUF952 family)
MIEHNSGAILHICSHSDWEIALAEGAYQADSLPMSGFIHCALPSQVLAVANNIYAGRTDLVLLWINPHHLKAEVRWEASETGIFPHVYGPINLEAVSAVLDFHPDEDGVFRIVPGILPE